MRSRLAVDSGRFVQPWRPRSEARFAALRMMVTLLLVTAPATLSAQTPTHWIDNGAVRVGVNANWGGAITWLSFITDLNRNFVNNGIPDFGRSIQHSFYRQDSYQDGWPCDNNGNNVWGWNPVQAGACGNARQHPWRASGVLSAWSNGTAIQTSTRPQQWNPNYNPPRSNILIQQSVSFHPNPDLRQVVQVDVTVTNYESFTIQGWRHELPVAYLAGFLQDAVTYMGASPFTHDPNLTAFTPPFGQGTGEISSSATTEGWIAWMHYDWNIAAYYGLALYVPETHDYVWKVHNWSDTKVMQSWANIPLNPGGSFSVRYYLIFGTIEGIRNAVYALR